MKATVILPTLCFIVSTFAGSIDRDYQNSVFCGQKNPHANTAIEKFCTKSNMVVPSKYAKEGHSHGNIHVAIHGDCNPAQWVPLEWCAPQFHAICAQAGVLSVTGSRHYGSNNCQKFTIEERNEIGH